MKARQKHRLTGPTTGCCPKKASCIEEKQRVRQPAVRYTQKKKQKKNKYIHTQTHKSESESELRQPAVKYTQKIKQTNTHACVSVYVCVYAERERISVTLVITAAQGCPSDLYQCVRARVCCYYFANLSTVSVCLPVHTVTHTHTQATLKTQENTCQVMIDNQHFHSSTVSRYSATRNTHTH